MLKERIKTKNGSVKLVNKIQFRKHSKMFTRYGSLKIKLSGKLKNLRNLMR